MKERVRTGFITRLKRAGFASERQYLIDLLKQHRGKVLSLSRSEKVDRRNLHRTLREYQIDLKQIREECK